MRVGTRGLFTITCPNPASVGARMAARIPASHSESSGNTRRAATAPRKIVSSMPVLNKRIGRFPMLRKSLKSVRLASVKSSNTRPISARRRKRFALNPTSSSVGSTGNMSIPATVNTMGAVTTVCSRRRETSANQKSRSTKTARYIIADRSY